MADSEAAGKIITGEQQVSVFMYLLINPLESGGQRRYLKVVSITGNTRKSQFRSSEVAPKVAPNSPVQ
jgi:hypothetical protein